MWARASLRGGNERECQLPVRGERRERRGLSTHRPPSMSIEKAVLNKVKAKNPSTFPTDGQNGRRA